MKPYYYVARVGGSPPTVKHDTLELARGEAMRLAAKHPGESFEILQCMGVARCSEPSVFWVDGVTPPHVCAPYVFSVGTCRICGKKIHT